MLALNSIPNILSSSRIAIAISFPFLPHSIRLPFLILALLTEFLDGFTARKFGWITITGEFLDPIADRILAVSVGLTLASTHVITPIGFACLFTRDITVAIGFLIYIGTGRDPFKTRFFKPNIAGKLTTALQYLVFLDILTSQKPNIWLVTFTATLSILAALIYTFRSFKNKHALIS